MDWIGLICWPIVELGSLVGGGSWFVFGAVMRWRCGVLMLRRMATKRGALIVFEGVDRCGKSTQTKMLVDALNQAGKPTEYMRFPGMIVLKTILFCIFHFRACKVQKLHFSDLFLWFSERTTIIGKIINEYLGNARELDDNVIHLLFSANRWELKSVFFLEAQKKNRPH
jgi:hypothetical protein